MADENVRDTRPTGTIVAIPSPAWWVDIAAAKNGSILQVHHPEHGWLVFVFPPESANKLGVTLVRHSALCEYFAGTLPPATVATYHTGYTRIPRHGVKEAGANA